MEQSEFCKRLVELRMNKGVSARDMSLMESFLAQQCAELKVISRMPMWLNWQSS